MSGSDTDIILLTPHGSFGTAKLVIDSSASSYISGNAALFSNFTQHIGNPSVTLIDGSKNPIKGVEHVSTSSLPLHFVLHVPLFLLNLLYVSKLVKSLDCFVTFSPSGCIF